MIAEIRIQQLGVIESSVVELGSGLTVITGETGAGKTMLVTALGLLLGARADPGAVRTGAGAARVEGLVNLAALPEAQAKVIDAGGAVEDNQVLIARNISAEGRSRAFLGGAGVPAAALSSLADDLVAVHGQSDQHRLLAPAAQQVALDRFAGAEVANQLKHYQQAFDEWNQCRAELNTLLTQRLERAREADLLRFGLAEIEAVEPQLEEEAALAAEESRLGYADALKSAAEVAHQNLSNDQAELDAQSAISAAASALLGVREHDPQAAALAERLAELSYLVADLAGDVAAYAHTVESDPLRLAAVSERRAALGALTRKYGESIAEVLTWAARADERLAELDHSDERIDFLTNQTSLLRDRVGELGGSLTAARERAALRLAELVSDELTGLAMPHAQIEISVSQQADADGVPVGERVLHASRQGLDLIEFGLSANPGSPVRPLHKGASGGELSRVMLALEVTLAGTLPVPTFVFDEVDAGVGGKAAIEVGRRLARLAKTAQVLVVTHLPQVAACADQHLVVSKSDDGVVTTSHLRSLSGQERETELSRMFAGLESSETARAHARELLANALIGI